MWGRDANVVILKMAMEDNHVSLDVFTFPITNKYLCPSFQIEKSPKKQKSHCDQKLKICEALADINCGKTHLSAY